MLMKTYQIKFLQILRRKNTNLPANYPSEIKDFASSVKSELLGSDFIKVKPNLTVDEREALEELVELQKSGAIVIQPADKGSGICILNREDYVNEANRQLNDTLVCEDGNQMKYYKKVSQETIKLQFSQIKEVLDEGVKKDYITKEFARLLTPPKPKPGTFYLLPKVQKSINHLIKSQKEDQLCLDLVQTLNLYLGFVTRQLRTQSKQKNLL